MESARRPASGEILHPRAKDIYIPQRVGNWPEASQRLLKTADVENLAADELALMRNEIFARHGYCFAKKNLRRQFENEPGTSPTLST